MRPDKGGDPLPLHEVWPWAYPLSSFVACYAAQWLLDLRHGQGVVVPLALAGTGGFAMWLLLSVDERKGNMAVAELELRRGAGIFVGTWALWTAWPGVLHSFNAVHPTTYATGVVTGILALLQVYILIWMLSEFQAKTRRASAFTFFVLLVFLTSQHRAEMRGLELSARLTVFAMLYFSTLFTVIQWRQSWSWLWLWSGTTGPLVCTAYAAPFLVFPMWWLFRDRLNSYIRLRAKEFIKPDDGVAVVASPSFHAPSSPPPPPPLPPRPARTVATIPQAVPPRVPTSSTPTSSASAASSAVVAAAAAAAAASASTTTTGTTDDTVVPVSTDAVMMAFARSRFRVPLLSVAPPTSTTTQPPRDGRLVHNEHVHVQSFPATRTFGLEGLAETVAEAVVAENVDVVVPPPVTEHTQPATPATPRKFGLDAAYLDDD